MGTNAPTGGILGAGGIFGNFGNFGAAILGGGGAAAAGILKVGSPPAAGPSSAAGCSVEEFRPSIPPEIIRVYSLGPLGGGAAAGTECPPGTEKSWVAPPWTEGLDSRGLSAFTRGTAGSGGLAGTTTGGGIGCVQFGSADAAAF